MSNLTPAELGYQLRIAPELEPLRKPLADFKPHPRNIRKHDLEGITDSMTRYGQQTPIVVQESTGLIVKGNGTYAAAKAMGADSMAVSIEEMDDDTAFRYLLEDNRTSDRAGYDVARTVDALQALIDGPGLDGTLWTADDLDDLVEQMGGLELPDEDAPEGEYLAAPEGYLKRKEQRDARLEGGGKLREVPLLVRPEAHDQLMKDVAELRRFLGLTGNIEAIVQGVRVAAELCVRQPDLVRGAISGIAPEEPAEPPEDLLGRMDDDARTRAFRQRMEDES